MSEAIRQLASRKKLSLEKLAVMSGMTNPTLHSILNKNDLRVSQLEALARSLEVPVAYFFEDTELPIEQDPAQTAKKDEWDDFWKEQIRLKDQIIIDTTERLKRCETALANTKNGGSVVFGE